MVGRLKTIGKVWKAHLLFQTATYPQFTYFNA